MTAAGAGERLDADDPRIRIADASDAARLLALQVRLDHQTSYMLLEPGERDLSVDALGHRLAVGASTTHGGFDLVADTGPLAASGGRAPLVGWLGIEVVPYRRARHVGHVVIGVDAELEGHGVGRGLLTRAARLAEKRGLARLELTVMTDNRRALGLYQSCGYTIEGTRRCSLVRDGDVVDEYYMARLLGSTGLIDGA